MKQNTDTLLNSTACLRYAVFGFKLNTGVILNSDVFYRSLQNFTNIIHLYVDYFNIHVKQEVFLRASEKYLNGKSDLYVNPKMHL